MTTAFNIPSTSSGLDVSTIVQNLVTAQSASVTLAQNQQKAYQSQISQLGALTSSMSTLKSAISNLKTSGALGVTQSGSTYGLTATPSSTATAGRYSVSVDQLAQAAKSRSNSFTSATDEVTAGTLSFSINGTNTDVEITQGMSLQDVAAAINQSGAAANATVLSSNGTAYLSITNKDTGFTVGGQASDALSITQTTTGSTGQALSFASVQDAKNAKVTIDGLQFERMSNTVDDALPGTTLNLTATGTTQDLVLANDTTATQANLQKFVDAYNGVMSILHNNLNIGQQTDRTYTLGGDSSIRQLQSQMMGIVSAVTNGTSSVRSLADLGIKTGNDGSLSIDSARLSKAISTDAGAVNNIFQNATDGVSDKFSKLVESYTNSTDGILVGKNKSFTDAVKRIGDQITTLQARLDKYRDRLIAQFTAMETSVSGFKSIGNYLTAQAKTDSSS